jgi:DNA-binding XRE family transcriptional regulator
MLKGVSGHRTVAITSNVATNSTWSCMATVNAIPDGKAVAKYRGMNGGMSQDTLARKAELSKRTIERIERDEPTTIKSLAQIAKVLTGGDVNKLLKFPSPSDGDALVIVKIGPKLYDSPQAAQRALLEKVLEIVREVKVVRIEWGSIWITLSLPARDVTALLEAAGRGALDDVGVDEISVLDPEKSLRENLERAKWSDVAAAFKQGPGDASWPEFIHSAYMAVRQASHRRLPAEDLEDVTQNVLLDPSLYQAVREGRNPWAETQLAARRAVLRFEHGRQQEKREIEAAVEKSRKTVVEELRRYDEALVETISAAVNKLSVGEEKGKIRPSVFARAARDYGLDHGLTPAAATSTVWLAFFMRFHLGLSNHEIAESLDLSDRGVSRKIVIVLKAIHEEIGEDER